MAKPLDSGSQDSGYTSNAGSQWSVRDDCLNLEDMSPLVSSSSQQSRCTIQIQNSSEESHENRRLIFDLMEAFQLNFNPEGQSYEEEGYARIRKECQQREEEYQRRKEEERSNQQNEFHSALSILVASKTKGGTTEDSEFNPEDTTSCGEAKYAEMREECQQREEEYRRSKREGRWQPNEFHTAINNLLASTATKSAKKPVQIQIPPAPKGYAAQYNKTMQEQDQRFWESVNQRRLKENEQKRQKARKLGKRTLSPSMNDVLSSFQSLSISKFSKIWKV